MRALALASLAGLVCVAVVKRTYSKAETPQVLRSELSLVDGRLCRTGLAKPFTGLMLERYADGTLRSRSGLVGGLLDGLSEGWHTNGQLQVRERFVRGVSQGLRTKWYARGTTQSQVPVVAGRMEGTLRRWHENGRLAEHVVIRQGRADGLAYAYHASGRLKARVRLQHGQVVEQQFWSDGDNKAAAAPDPH